MEKVYQSIKLVIKVIGENISQDNLDQGIAYRDKVTGEEYDKGREGRKQEGAEECYCRTCQ